jgi:hypothetical protein
LEPILEKRRAFPGMILVVAILVLLIVVVATDTDDGHS